MTNNDPRDRAQRPEPAEPHIGGKRPVVGPLLGVIGVIVVIIVLFLLITWLTHNT